MKWRALMWGLLNLGMGVFIVACTSGGNGSLQDVDGDSDLGEVSEFGRVTGTVRLMDGGDPAGAEVELDGVVRVVGGGAFLFEGVLPGSYTMQARLSGYDASQQQVTVIAGEESEVDFVLRPESMANRAPEIESLSLDPESLARGGQAQVSCVAFDPDADDLTYRWSVDGGFSVAAQEPGIALVSAPDELTAGTLWVEVSDPSGATDSASLVVATIDNEAPVVEGFELNPGLVEPGGILTVEVNANDPDGEELSYTWTVDDETWSIAGTQEQVLLTAPMRYGAQATLRVRVEDERGGVAIANQGIATEACPTGTVDCDGDASNGCEALGTGLGELCPLDSCSSLPAEAASGLYWLSYGGDPEQTWCEQSLAGGGWTTVAVISGAGEDLWSTEESWVGNSVFGQAGEAWSDFKSLAWTEMDVSGSDVLLVRRFQNEVRGQVVVDMNCLNDAASLASLFEGTPSLACERGDLEVLQGDAAGVRAGFAEGEEQGLGGEDTHGLCWKGGASGEARIAWGASSGEACDELLGGASELNEGDIADLPWFEGVAREEVSIALLVRARPTLSGDFSSTDPGRWSDGSLAKSCLEYRQSTEAEDGIYIVDSDGDTGEGLVYRVFCDMTTDGGGWTLLATVAGGDEDHWSDAEGSWVDDQGFGDLGQPLMDYKSPAWWSMSIAGKELLLARAYNGAIHGQTVMGANCIGNASHMSELFSDWDTDLACSLSDLRVLSHSAMGLSSADYEEGVGVLGLGSASTNGFCWNGGVAGSEGFRGRLMWQGDVLATDCYQQPTQSQSGGGVGVFDSEGLVEVGDISGSDWLDGVTHSEVAVQLWLR